MKVLMTGFAPFGGECVNPAWEAVKLLPDHIGEARLIKAEIPTAFSSSGKRLEALLEEHEPNLTICVGQAGGYRGIAVERVAVNLQDASIPDNEGEQPVDVPVRADGPAAYFSRLPTRAIVDGLKKRGIPAFLSYSAGTYVCNHLMYVLLDRIERRYPEMRGGFLHVPYSDGQAAAKAPGTFGMEIPRIAEALAAAVQISLSDEA